MSASARREWLSDCVDQLKRNLGAEAAHTRLSVNADERIALWHRLAKLSATLADDTQDALARSEGDQLRPLILDMRDFARRNNLTLARPRWSPAPQTRSANFVYFSGPNEIRRSLQRVARTRGLEVSAQSYPGAEPSDARWRDLNAASVAAFDLSGNDPQVYYDLGIALALGSELMLLTRAGAALPFDVEQDVVEYPVDGPGDAFLAQALDAAVYAVTPGAGALGDVMYQLEALTGPNPATSAELVLSEATKAKDDPMALHAVLRALLPTVSDTQEAVLRPRWPCPSLNPGPRSCFIVMPFRDVLKPTHEVIASRARAAGLIPTRGDESPGQDIVKRIWAELVRADRIVVDLTGFNPNVCLELGMAHTLGRPALLVGQRGTEEALFSSVAKLECHGYDSPASEDHSFVQALDRFLSVSALVHGSTPCASPSCIPPCQHR